MTAESLFRDQADSRIAALTASGQKKPHGTRARYVAGKCRCFKCGFANTAYRRKRDMELRSDGVNLLVSAAGAKAHIEKLSKYGIGYKTVADASGISKSVIQRIIWGPRRNIRKSTSDRILSVDRSCLPDSASVSSDRAWRIIDRLLAEGYTKSQIALWLGHKTPALQFRRGHAITARNASKLERLAKLINEGRLKRA